LAKPEVMNEFVNKIKSIPADAIEAAEIEYRDASDRASTLNQAQDAYNGPMGEESNQNKRDFAGLKRLSKKADLELNEKTDVRFSALEQRRVGLETAVNEFLTDHGLPKIELLRTYQSASLASYLDGQVRVDEWMLLSKKAEPELINSIYHELAHLRQDALHINLLADKLEIPALPTEAESDLVKSEFKRIRAKSFEVNEREKDSNGTGLHVFEMYAPVTPEYENAQINRFIDQVLKLRSENGLSETEKPLAKEMSRGIATYSDQNYVENWRTTERQLGTLKDVVQHPYSGNVDRILRSVLESPHEFQQDYGFKTIPSDFVKLAQEHRLSSYNESSPTYNSPNFAAQERYYDRMISHIEPTLQKQLNALSVQMLDLNELKRTRYMRNTLEVQAFPTGILAEIAYNAQR
jgi:hypothetical protein